ncbi:uncharacterized protein LOC127276948 [Leptopilina boulardi]|uniref:uncharacterized protein LOC127276948 n=1 Tax=Leptopilina boulardi TaxID=63433 RepID=UPI0021F64BCE|nr:uncharacterized protein LOC127276948 [Leptopilina boulardi]
MSQNEEEKSQNSNGSPLSLSSENREQAEMDMSVDDSQPASSVINNEENDQVAASIAEEEIEITEIESQNANKLTENHQISRNKPKDPDINMDIEELVKSIGDSLIFYAHSFQRKLIKKVNKKMTEIENSVGKHTNTPVLLDVKEKIKVLQIVLPMEDVEIFKVFD